MKRIIFLLIIAIAMPVATNAITQSEGAKIEIGKISKHLTSKGIKHLIDSDGDIMINLKEINVESSIFANTYITVTSDQPYFVKIFCPVPYGTRDSREKVEALAESINIYKCVKLITFENSYSIQCEMLIRNSSFFNSVIEKLFMNLSFAIEDFEELINEL